MGYQFLDKVSTQVSLGAILPVALVACAVGYVIYQRAVHPLAKIPGPFSASLSRLWITKHSWDGDMMDTMIALHAKHGSLVRTGPNEVSVSDLAAIKKIYSAGTKFRKSDWYSVMQGHRKFDLFPERNEKLHGKQRSLVSRAYSMDALKDLEPYVSNAVKVFLDHMDKREGQDIDMGKWVQLFAFDVIGEMTFSKSFGFMEAGDDNGTFKQIETVLRSAAWLGQVPAVLAAQSPSKCYKRADHCPRFWWHDRASPYIGNHLGVTQRHGSLRTMAVNAVAARRDKGSDRKDILSKLFATQKEKPTELGQTDVESMATSNIFAGSDTTAISTRAILYYLLKNPDKKKKLVDEIDERRKQGKLSDPVQLNEADEMPYLQAVMYEALRLHPAVGLSLPRVVPEGGFEVDGHYLPSETIIGTNPWVVHRDKEVYGDDVDAFRPERWIENDPADMHRFFFAFGSGARMCLGRNISWLEMSKLIPTLFMHYEMELSDPNAEWTLKCWWFVLQRGLNIKLNKRKT